MKKRQGLNWTAFDVAIAILLTICIFSVCLSFFRDRSIWTETKALCMDRDCKVIGDYLITCKENKLVSIAQDGLPMENHNHSIDMRLCVR